MSVGRLLHLKPVIGEHTYMGDALTETLSKLDWAIFNEVHIVLHPFMALHRVLEGGQ